MHLPSSFIQQCGTNSLHFVVLLYPAGLSLHTDIGMGNNQAWLYTPISGWVMIKPKQKRLHSSLAHSTHVIHFTNASTRPALGWMVVGIKAEKGTAHWAVTQKTMSQVMFCHLQGWEDRRGFLSKSLVNKEQLMLPRSPCTGGMRRMKELTWMKKQWSINHQDLHNPTEQ